MTITLTKITEDAKGIHIHGSDDTGYPFNHTFKDKSEIPHVDLSPHGIGLTYAVHFTPLGHRVVMPTPEVPADVTAQVEKISQIAEAPTESASPTPAEPVPASDTPVATATA